MGIAPWAISYQPQYSKNDRFSEPIFLETVSFSANVDSIKNHNFLENGRQEQSKIKKEIKKEHTENLEKWKAQK